MPLLAQRRIAAYAFSRTARPDTAGVTWLRGSLEAMPALPDSVDTLVSVGPLDAFANWLRTAEVPWRRVVAISSTGRNDKANSPDPRERELAARLAQAESSLLQVGRDRGAAVTILRPTLLYGSGRDRSLSRLVELARRWKFLPLPANASGLRQPVHVADVADAILRCLDVQDTGGRTFDLPGGEALPFLEMVRRTIERHVPTARIITLPVPFFHVAAWATRPFVGTIGQGLLARLAQDQVADASPAHAAFGYAPRRFEP